MYEETSTCPVCLETPLRPDTIRQFSCNHEVCQRCYVTHTARSVRCPFCRRPIQDTVVAKMELVQTILSNLSDIERSLQKLQTCGFPKALKNETEIRNRIEKIVKEMSNQGIYDGAGPLPAVSVPRYSMDEDLANFLRALGGDTMRFPFNNVSNGYQ